MLLHLKKVNVIQFQGLNMLHINSDAKLFHKFCFCCSITDHYFQIFSIKTGFFLHKRYFFICYWYISFSFSGESALHIAIVFGCLDAVKLLIEKGAKIDQRSTGRFFLPEDQKKGHTKTTNYEGSLCPPIPFLICILSLFFTLLFPSIFLLIHYMLLLFLWFFPFCTFFSFFFFGH